MNCKKVVLITAYYPYSPPQESFLELEVSLIASKVSLIVAPQFVGNDIREVSSLITVIDSLNMEFYTSHKIGKLLRILFGFFSFDFWKEISYNPHILLETSLLIKLLIFTGMSKVCLWKVERLIKSDESYKNAVFYCYWLRNAAFAIANLKKKYPKIKLIVRAHNLEFNKETQKDSYLPLINQLIRRLDAVCFVSRFGYQYVRREYGVDENCYIEYLGIERHNRLAKISDRGFLNVVSCSFVRDVKRIHLIIEGLSEFSQKYKNIHVSWTHMGGADKDNSLYTELKKLAEKMLVRRGVNVNWQGFVPNHMILDFYRDKPVDVFVNLSEFEGIPVAVMEAASCGIPIIATEVGGVSELVTPEVGVLLQKDFSASEFVSALNVTYNKNNYEIRQKCKKSVYKRFSGENNYMHFCEKYLLSE